MTGGAIFLDRDGTLVDFVSGAQGPRTVRNARELALRPGSAEALARLRAAGFRLFLASNQPGVAKGHFTMADLEAMNQRLQALLRTAGVRLDALYCCPHHPTEGQGSFRGPCPCRKPNTGMIRAGLAAWSLAGDASFMIGDRRVDMLTGRRAGLRTVLVDSPHTDIDGHTDLVDHRAPDLATAADWIVAARPASPHPAPPGVSR